MCSSALAYSWHPLLSRFNCMKSSSFAGILECTLAINACKHFHSFIHSFIFLLSKNFLFVNVLLFPKFFRPKMCHPCSLRRMVAIGLVPVTLAVMQPSFRRSHVVFRFSKFGFFGHTWEFIAGECTCLLMKQRYRWRVNFLINRSGHIFGARYRTLINPPVNCRLIPPVSFLLFDYYKTAVWFQSNGNILMSNGNLTKDANQYKHQYVYSSIIIIICVWKPV